MRNPIPPPPRKGWCSVCERLSPSELEEVRRLRFGEGWGYLRLAKRYGSSRSTMHRHIKGDHAGARVDAVPVGQLTALHIGHVADVDE